MREARGRSARIGFRIRSTRRQKRVRIAAGPARRDGFAIVSRSAYRRAAWSSWLSAWPPAIYR
ncbi:hypothetical protein [Lysobacter gummosus]|uniref:hypothetical protein n=1 Tax=Lysobacter gummosus TaxID=262324 RepID=UPI0036306B31